METGEGSTRNIPITVEQSRILSELIFRVQGANAAVQGAESSAQALKLRLDEAVSLIARSGGLKAGELVTTLDTEGLTLVVSSPPQSDV